MMQPCLVHPASRLFGGAVTLALRAAKGGAKGGAEEMMLPSLIHLHLISLVALTTGRRRKRVRPGSPGRRW